MANTPWEGFLFGTAVLALLYNLRQLAPTHWLQVVLNDTAGYSGDIFLSLGERIIAPTAVIREAFEPGGALSVLLPYSRWRETYGDAMENLFNRLTSASGRVRDC